ncbi:uncharacterized protein LOC122662570 [Telopea speciosissima]|uniref:uncharacterized protein LOC122662570 n=1 Tax=Telopea speciosissima TaxID=54955 RepID=UPI001CC4CC55|nr:uncharacterized protein LOC122662570 [Telopea speciosissima]
MASNTNTTTPAHQVTERTNAEGLHETVVDTVDYRSYPGQDPQGQLKKENVEVIHQYNPDQEGSGPGAGVLGGAVAAVTNTIKSAKNAISGGGAARTGTGTGTTPDSLPISQGQPK